MAIRKLEEGAPSLQPRMVDVVTVQRPPEGDSFDDFFEDSGEADTFSQLASEFQLPAEISKSHLPEVFPLPCLSFPHEPVSASARVRKRFTRKRKLCKIVNGLINFLNFLYKGSRANSHTAAFVHSLPYHQWQGAQKSVLRRFS